MLLKRFIHMLGRHVLLHWARALRKENICGCVSAIHGSPVELHAGFGASCKEGLSLCVHQRIPMKCVM